MIRDDVNTGQRAGRAHLRLWEGEWQSSIWLDIHGMVFRGHGRTPTEAYEKMTRRIPRPRRTLRRSLYTEI